MRSGLGRMPPGGLPLVEVEKIAVARAPSGTTRRGACVAGRPSQARLA